MTGAMMPADLFDDGLDQLIRRPEPVKTPDPVVSQPRVSDEPPVALRDPLNSRATRAAIYDAALGRLRDLPPITNQRYSLKLSNPRYVDPDDYGPAAHKATLLTDGTASRRIRGEWTLTDVATGAEVGRKSGIVAAVPVYGDDGVFTLNGSDYTLANQKRLRPGVYARRRENGELDGHVNVLPGAGVSHHVALDEKTGKFTLRIGTSNFPLITALRAMNVRESDIRDVWGPLYAVNAAADTGNTRDLYAKLVRGGGATGEVERRAGIKAALEAMPLDPEVTRRTLGFPAEKVTAKVYIDLAKKLVAINRGEADSDDRDDDAYMTVMTPAELIAERAVRDQSALRKALWKITMSGGDLSKLPSGVFTKGMTSAIMSSGLGQVSESVNPAMFIEQAGRVSRLGVGAIGSTNAVPEESRSVHPSHFGFVDPISTPESAKAGVDARFASAARFGADGRMYSRFRDARTGKLKWVTAADLHDAVVAFPGSAGEGLGVIALDKGRMRYADPREVDYVFPNMEEAFGPLGNLVPMKSAVKGQRLSMGARMLSQALPLVGAEAPLVRSGVPGEGDESYEELYGKYMGATRAETRGWVKSVAADKIEIEGADGKVSTVQLASHLPRNTKTGFNQTPVVHVGQEVGPGDLLARSNYTDAAGVTALGRNLRVGLTSGPGEHANYEDAWVISKSAADKLRSEHYYQYSADLTDDAYKMGKNAFVAAFPGTYDRRVLDRFDDSGVIKPGSKVDPGDPLILGVRERREDRATVHKGRGPSYREAAEVWEHESPGIVTDVVTTPRGARVVVRTEVPAKVGDKLCLASNHDVLTSVGWRPIADVLPEHEVACLIDDVLTYRRPEAIHHFPFGGRMYKLTSDEVNLLVTAEHRLYVREPGKVAFGFGEPADVFGRDFEHASSGGDGGRELFPVFPTNKRELWIDDYAGSVHCLTVPGGVFYARDRDTGRAVWTGNSNRYGGKGLIGSIIADDQMPRDADGNVLDLLYNDQGIISRGNASAIYEMALGAIARKTGKSYAIKDFDKIDDLADFVADELDKHDVKVYDHIVDSRNGRKIPNVLVGDAFFMKLHHTAESKNQSRDIGGYTADGTPSRGGDNSAKRVALMSMNALLGHGATGLVRDASVVAGQENLNYWNQFMAGHPAPAVQTPFVHRKFIEQLKGAGINVVREGSKFKMMALRGSDVDELAGGRELRNGETVDAREGLKEVPGGLFDPKLTGGHGGKRWSSLKLTEPMPSPVFEEPIRRILGLTEDKFRDVMAGREKFRERTGPAAIAGALNDVNLKEEIRKARTEIAGGKKTIRDSAIKRLKYLKAADEQGVHPRDWVWSRFPVIPPLFRPVSVMRDTGRLMNADANVLYGELFAADKNLRDMRDAVDDVGDERLAVYDAMKAVTGIDEPIRPKTRERGVRGFIKEITGDAPKRGVVQRKLLSTTVDLVGRSVIVPNPNLDMDSVEIPEEHAWKVYSPFVIRRLRRRGASGFEAKRLVENKDKAAKEALLAEMAVRPVILDRAPVLHKYGVMAFWPKLSNTSAIKLTPLVCVGFNADFDGDQMNYRVPVTDAAVGDAIEKLMPSKNLISSQTFKVHQLPNREFLAGLWLATRKRDNSRKPIVFRSIADAKAAYNNGEIAVDDPIQIVK